MSQQDPASDRQDYLDACEDLGVTPEFVADVSRREDDVIPDEKHSQNVYVADSVIEGHGTHAAKAFPAGEIVCPLMSRYYRTIAGRYINHSKTPNVQAIVIGSTIWAMAITNICKDEEITADYRQVKAATTGLE